MKTKINKISIAAVVGVFAIAMFAALAWSTVAGNALATDNEVTETANVEAPEIAAEETVAKVAEPEATEAKEAADEDAESQPNAEVQISFDVVGLDEGVTPVFTLVDKGEQIDYKLGDKLPIDASESQIRYGTKNNPAITIQDKNHYYNFRASCLGYDFDSYVPPKPTKHIQEDTDFKMVFKKSTDPYNIEITLRDEGGSEIEGVEANFYNKNWEHVAGPAISDEGGVFEFNNLSAEDAIGTIVVKKNSLYCDFFAQVGEDVWSRTTSHNFSAQITLNSLSDADFIYDCDDPMHDCFVINYTITSATTGETRTSQYCTPDATLYWRFSEGTITVNEEGSLVIGDTLSRSGDISYRSYSLTAVPKDDSSVIKHWLVDTGSNGPQIITPGQSIDLHAGDSLNIQPVYSQPIPPDPDPDPTPTPAEEVTATAQTGDSTAALPLAILAIAAGSVVFITRRKFN